MGIMGIMRTMGVMYGRQSPGALGLLWLFGDYSLNLALQNGHCPCLTRTS